MVIKFHRALNETSKKEFTSKVKLVTPVIAKKIVKSYQESKKRLLLLDYDGTIIGFNENPEKVVPPKSLLDLLENLNSHENTDVVIMSGRTYTFLDKHFSGLNLTLVAEHGLYLKQKDGDWHKKKGLSNKWIEHLLPVLNTFTDNTPGTFIEHKTNSLSWHYRKADPELGTQRAVELKTVLKRLLPNDLTLLDGNKVLELMPSNINKGISALDLINQKNYDFCLAAGDDITDESMFSSLPSRSYKIKVGKKKTSAEHYMRNIDQFLELLKLINNSEIKKEISIK